VDERDDTDRRLEQLSKRIAEATEKLAAPKAPERSKMSIRERVAYVREHGADAYLELPWSSRPHQTRHDRVVEWQQRQAKRAAKRDQRHAAKRQASPPRARQEPSHARP
jgi:hypothetical protein